MCCGCMLSVTKVHGETPRTSNNVAFLSPHPSQKSKPGHVHEQYLPPVVHEKLELTI
jgi:hypothetical protein